MLNSTARAVLILAGAGAGLGGCVQPAGRAVTPAAVAALPNGQPGQEASGVRPTAGNQAVLDALTGPLRLRPYHTLAPSEARLQPSFADGVVTAAQQADRLAAPPSGIATREIQVAGAAGPLPARVYRPAAAPAGVPLSVIVYFHGDYVVCKHVTEAVNGRRFSALAARQLDPRRQRAGCRVGSLRSRHQHRRCSRWGRPSLPDFRRAVAASPY